MKPSRLGWLHGASLGLVLVFGCTRPEALTHDSNPSGSDTGPEIPAVEPIDSRLSIRDYGYLFWPGNHWVSWGTYEDVQYVQTGHYALALDVSTGSLAHMGPISEEYGPEEALSLDNSIVTDLPTAGIRYAVEHGGTEWMATSFAGSDGSTTNPSDLVDMGRFMQRVDIPQVSYADFGDLGGSVQLAAMTRHFVLTHRTVSESGATEITIRTELYGEAVAAYPETTWIEENRAVSVHDGAGTGWSFVIPEQAGASPGITRSEDGTLRFETTFDYAEAGEEIALSVIAVPSNAGGDDQLAVWLNPDEAVTVRYAQLQRDGSGGETLSEAVWDTERGLYLIELRDLSEVGAPGYPDYTDASQHNWYNRHRLVIDNHTESAVSVPLAFDGNMNAAFYITGGIPMLRDMNGEPTGIPVQISKNWHETPYWYHLYSAILLEPGSHEFEHTFAHSKWGETYAAQHSQLCLRGWGQDQQWDESSLGAWGESITYDPDMTLARAQVDDVRPFLVNAGSEWGWTGNVGGASFLVYEPTEGYTSFASHQLGRMRTHYAYTGPNLTHVLYDGITADGKIHSRVSTQLGRTDDLVRAYYHLEYTFLEDVNYDRLALFQMAADRYGDNGFTRYAYGNETEVFFDGEITDHESSGYASETHRGISVEGDAPWVMLYQNTRTDGSLPEHLADIGFVIRDYRADIEGVETTTPVLNIVQTYNNYSQMAFELGVPYDGENPVVPAGSTVRATVEYVVPPAIQSTYYGDSDYLTTMDSSVFRSTDMMQRLATDNHLEVTTSVGTLRRSHPVEIDADNSETAVQFTLTGGLGYTPITIHGLTRPDGWRLEQEVDGHWERVDQSVEGNDYWQAYDDVASHRFDLVFNVHNRGTNQYRLVR